MNLFRKIFPTFLCTFLINTVWAQQQYPSLDKEYTIQQVDSFVRYYAKQNDLKGQAIAYELQGMFFQKIYFYGTSTFKSYLQSAELYLKVDDLESHYRIKKRIADFFSIDDELSTIAVDFYKETLGYYETKKDSLNILSIDLGMLNLLINKDSLQGKSKITRFPDVEGGLRSAIKRCKALKDDHQLTYAYNLYASFLLQTKNLEMASHYNDLSYSLSKSYPQFELPCIFQKALIQKSKRDLPGAVSTLRDCELIAEIRNHKYLMQHICQNLAECYSLLDDQKQALIYWKKTAAAVNRFYNSAETRPTRNDYADSEIRLLNSKQELADQKQRTWDILTYGLILGLVMFGIIAYLVFQSRMRAKDLANQRKISDLELKSMKSLIEGQEKERNRVAKDLHDGLGAHLSSIKLFVESQRDKFDPAVQQKLLNPLAKNIDDACLETRSISHDLRPFSLKYGFNSALGDLVKKAQTALPEAEVIFDSYGEEPPISEEIALMVYRVVQELLNNAAKYAKANQITVQIFFEPDQLSVHVEDDGQGFDLKQVKEGNGLGNIRSRIDYLGGQVIWQAAPQQGTAVILSVPLQNRTKT